MSRFHTRMLLAVAALALAGCAELGEIAQTVILESGPTASPGPVGSLPTAAPGARSLVDRPDEVTGLQFHVVYMISADAEDGAKDTNGVIRSNLGLINEWMKLESEGSTFRYDLAGGQPDITFVRMKATNAELKAEYEHFLKHVQEEMLAAGLDDPLKKYVVYYDGDVIEDLNASGVTVSNFSTIFCKLFKTDDYTIVSPHEMVHALGFARPCSPHYVEGSHIQDGLADVIGDGFDHNHVDPRFSKHLDPGHDDYFKAHIPGCADLSQSPYLDPLPADAVYNFPTNRPLVTTKPVDGTPIAIPANPVISFGELAVAPGPAHSNTVTVYGKVVLPAGSPNRYVTCSVDKQIQSNTPASEPHAFYASVLATGSHTLTFWAVQEAGGTYDPKSVIKFDVVDGKPKLTK